ncbi:MAG: TldD/PmbA family protein [Coriobacteriia bacterium]
MITAREARELAKRAVAMTDADQAEAVVIAEESALTRFANNHVHQNVSETDARISIRAVVGRRQGVAATNRFDDESLAACAARAAEYARLAPEDEHFPGLPGPAPVRSPNRLTEATVALDPAARADAARALIAPSASAGFNAAGKVAASDAVVAVANSLGVDVGMGTSNVTANVLSMADGAGTGWASFIGGRADELDPEALGEDAADLASRSREPKPLEPGSYTVVLAPDAVAEMLAMLAYVGFSAKAVEEGSSFMAGRIGERLFSESVTIRDDALSEEAIGLTFDFEGMPKHPVDIIERGVVKGPVTDSYWAARTKRNNTGHALPAPNTLGPFPLDLEMAPGASTVDEMVASIEKGVYVTRFHYVNVEDPVKAVLTGMTRDGTFMIENGRLTKPLKNLRFTQSAVEALARVVAVGSERRRAGEMSGAVLAPALAIEGFGITGQTG